jgi:probable rRNA maturation factor
MEPAACMTVVEIDQSAEVARIVNTAWLRDHLNRVVEHLPQPVGRIGLLLVGDPRMIELNRRHHGSDQTTDVLTFPLSGPGEAIDVDIALCVDEAARRAAELAHPLERELLLYALHGLLHCAGFDDHDEAGFAAMHAEEDRILEAVGVGATFRRQAGGEDQR